VAELQEFDEQGMMRRRLASIDDAEIRQDERRIIRMS
jgi:nuclear transport factor 2 (NTF2) superfamily protein